MDVIGDMSHVILEEVCQQINIGLVTDRELKMV